MGSEAVAEWARRGDPVDFPYEAVVAAFLSGGKQFVDPRLLAALDQVRASLSARDATGDGEHRLLSAFLDVALDKWDGAHDYPHYTALSLLGLPDVEEPVALAPSAAARRDRLVLLLLADTLRFELGALDGKHALLPRMRPDAATVAKRCRLALRVVRPVLARLDEHVPPEGEDPVTAARAVVRDVADGLAPADARLLRVSLLPVFVVHDEYLFLRVLQLFEVTFATLAVQLQAALLAAEEGQVCVAARLLGQARSALQESSPLFSLLATMRVEAFHVFRQYTEGASAIQSRSYKVVESICRRPDRDRLDSPAFLSVPEVRARVLAGQHTLDDTLLRVRGDETVPEAVRAELELAMAGFAGALQRWRQTHYSLAVRMLGTRSGTGYTSGTPYLDVARTVPVFEHVPRQCTGGAATEATR